MSRLAPPLALCAVAACAWLPLVTNAVANDPGVLIMSDVSFPHELHYAEMELECVTCHHETNAAELAIPHEEYFQDFWSNCKTCHGSAASSSQSCSSCHHDSPVDLADETLSAKVVIHRSCWSCHEVGTGPEASQSCKSCHESAKATATGGQEP